MGRGQGLFGVIETNTLKNLHNSHYSFKNTVPQMVSHDHT